MLIRLGGREAGKIGFHSWMERRWCTLQTKLWVGRGLGLVQAEIRVPEAKPIWFASAPRNLDRVKPAKPIQFTFT